MLVKLVRRGCRGGLGPTLVDLDERLVNDVGDRQLARTRDTRKISRPQLESQRHAQFGQRGLELARFGHLELR